MQDLNKLIQETLSNPEYEAFELIDKVTDNILLIMKERKINNAKLAKLIGMSPQAVGQFFHADRNVKVVTLVKIVRALGYKLDISVNPKIAVINNFDNASKEVFDEHSDKSKNKDYGRRHKNAFQTTTR